MLNRRLESERATDFSKVTRSTSLRTRQLGSSIMFCTLVRSSQLHCNMHALSVSGGSCAKPFAGVGGSVGGWVDWSRCLRRHDKTLAARTIHRIARPCLRAGFGYKHRGSNVSIGLMSALLVRAYWFQALRFALYRCVWRASGSQLATSTPPAAKHTRTPKLLIHAGACNFCVCKFSRI